LSGVVTGSADSRPRRHWQQSARLTLCLLNFHAGRPKRKNSQ
jgi:hypothetical protein